MEQAAKLQNDDLVRRSVEGDREAFEMLVRQHQPEIYRFFRRSCATEEDARDQCQLAFVRAYRGLPGFQGRSSFRTWLFRIAVNLVRNYHRDRGRRSEVSLTNKDGQQEMTVPSSAPSTLSLMQTGQHREQLREAVQKLPPRQRSVVIWRIYHDLSFAEIAAAEEITTNNAKVTYCHAVRSLKNAFVQPAGAEARP